MNLSFALTPWNTFGGLLQGSCGNHSKEGNQKINLAKTVLSFESKNLPRIGISKGFEYTKKDLSTTYLVYTILYGDFAFFLEVVLSFSIFFSGLRFFLFLSSLSGG